MSDGAPSPPARPFRISLQWLLAAVAIFALLLANATIRYKLNHEKWNGDKVSRPSNTARRK